jgi:hypothetical protein
MVDDRATLHGLRYDFTISFFYYIGLCFHQNKRKNQIKNPAFADWLIKSMVNLSLNRGVSSRQSSDFLSWRLAVGCSNIELPIHDERPHAFEPNRTMQGEKTNIYTR